MFDLVIIYVMGGLLFTYLTAIAIDISQTRRYNKREKQIIQSIVRGA